MMSEVQRDKTLDILKGIATLLVIIGHSAQIIVDVSGGVEQIYFVTI